MMALARARSSSERIGRSGNRRFIARNRRNSTATAPPSLLLPVSTFLFLVRHGPVDVELAPGIADDDDEPELISADVEDHEPADLVGMGIISANVLELLPGRVL